MKVARWSSELLARVRTGELSPRAALALAQAGEHEGRAARQPESSSDGGASSIAIVGMACRFPDADGIAEFWQLLASGRTAFRQVPASRWSSDEFYAPDAAAPGRSYCKTGAFLRDAGRFDWRFFGLSLDEARLMDPQQRLFLEVAWSAMEHAGYGAGGGSAPVGVFAGGRASSYASELALDAEHDGFGRAGILGSSQNYIAAWIADRMDLRGPAMVVDSACSSSLVAVHLACKSLLTRECDMALAGGVDLLLAPASFVHLSKAKVLSPSAACRPLDRAADGYLPGEGCGVVILKRLADARRDGDRIHAVIRGSFVNNDGHTMGITTPNFKAQEEVIRRALEVSRVSAESITYIEAHGTATMIGDPIELRALHEVFGDSTLRGTCGIGSVKSNIGHLHSAAGIAGLLKVVLCLRHQTLVPTLGCDQPNPRFAFEASPFYPVAGSAPWQPREGVRRAGVSSFGFGGTNCHVVLEEAPRDELRVSAPASAPCILCLSAATPTALERQIDRFVEFASSAEAQAASFEDIAFTANAGRRMLAHRAVLSASTIADAAERLKQRASKANGVRCGVASKSARPRLVYLFPGQGTQSFGMCRDLYERYPEFRRAIAECEAAVAGELDVGLVDLLYGSRDEGRLIETRHTQPALFAVEYAIFSLLSAWGLKPAAVLGHSLGEYVAASVSGAIDVADAIRLVARRGRLMSSLQERGKMAAVLAPEAVVRAVLDTARTRVAVAAVNGATNTVISGPAAELDHVLATFKQQDVACVELQVSQAFHSPLMKPIVEAFREELAKVAWRPPKVPFIGNALGRPLESGDWSTYWIDQLLGTVRFADCVRHLMGNGYRHFIEIGPGITLGNFVQGLALHSPEQLEVLPSWTKQRGAGALVDSIVALVAAGCALDWRAYYSAEKRRRTSLPTYPFEGEALPIRGASAKSSASPPGSRREDAARAPVGPSNGSAAGGENWMLRADDAELSQHRIGGLATLPATALMLRAFRAASEGAGGSLRGLRSVALLRAVTVDHSAELRISFEGPRFRIVGAASSHGGIEPPLYATGELARHEEAVATSLVDVAGMLRDCSGELSGVDLYAHFSSIGFEYGPAFRALVRARYRPGLVIAELQAPPAQPDAVRDAGLLDGALQAALVLLDPERVGRQWVPFAFNSVDFLAPLSERAIAICEMDGQFSSRDEPARLRVRLVDGSGRLCVDLRGVSHRRLRPRLQRPPIPVWRQAFAAATREPNDATRLPAGPYLFFVPDAVHDAAPLRGLEAGVDIVRVVASDRFERLERRRYAIRPDRLEDYEKLREALAADALLPKHVVHAWLCGPSRAAESEIALGVASCFCSLRAFAGNATGARFALITRDACGSKSGSPVPARAAARAFVRSAALEYGPRDFTLIDLTPDTDGVARGLGWLLDAANEDRDVVLDGQRVLTPRLLPAELAPAPPPLSDGCVCLLTGGASGIGLELAKMLARRYHAKLGIVGRHAAEGRHAALREIEALGAEVTYLQADVTDLAQLRAACARLRSAHGPIQAAFHLAGVTNDRLMRSKTLHDIERVLAPKLAGSMNLVAALEPDPLRALVFFSSLSAVLGNVGQTDYAAANGFMDALALQLRRAGTPALSINWSVWEGPGMGARDEVLRLARERGAPPLQKDRALLTLEYLLETGAAQAVVAELEARPAAAVAPAATTERSGFRSSEAAAARVVRELLESLGVATATDEQRTFLELGLDSAALVRVTSELERLTGVRLYPTLLFEHQTVDALAEFLCSRFGAELAPLLNRPAPSDAPIPAGQPSPQPALSDASPTDASAAEAHAVEPPSPSATDPDASPALVSTPADDRAIAIIGMAGRFPGARDLASFWRNLRDGVDGVQAGSSEALQGGLRAGGPTAAVAPARTGFLSGVAEFDPQLFGISPREALLMDPQQRLFLEVAWEAIENAGHSPKSLAGSDTGVFVGATYNYYLEELVARGYDIDAHAALGTSKAILPNRVSHYFDFRGPSFSVDTLCSSSLLSVLLACESLRRGECRLALAGGVCAILSKSYFDVLNRMKVLSPSGACRSFDAGADGYVPGEGVGAVLLKPLPRALADGDHIHAVIRGGAVNHDGRSSSLTAPNPRSQRELLWRAWADAGVSPEDLEYIEAHGTGTALGDPIEIAALTEAFAKYTRRRQFSAIGAVKSSIGHLEPAAGIAGLMKVVLSLQHGQIPPNLHFERPNRFIPFTASPFFVPERSLPWPAPTRPRRAAVSSFGMGGVNAHLVLEQAPQSRRAAAAEKSRHWALLSGPNRDVLARMGRDLAAHLRSPGIDGPPALGDVCFTLATGRNHWPCRRVVEADSLALLSEALEAESVVHEVARGQAVTYRLNRPAMADAERALISRLERLTNARISADAALDLTEHVAAAARDADTALMRCLAEFWARGAEVDWRSYYGDRLYRRVPLPTYPFERQTYWPGELGNRASAMAVAPATNARRATPAAPDENLVRMFEWQEISRARVLPGRVIVADGGGEAASELVAKWSARGLLVHTQSLLDDQPLQPEPDATLLYLSLPEPSAPLGDADGVQRALTVLHRLTQRLSRADAPPYRRIVVVTRGAHVIHAGDEHADAAGAAVAAFARGVANELRFITFASVDLDPSRSLAEQADALLEELASTDAGEVALRGGRRWARSLAVVPPAQKAPSDDWFVPGGVYWITGGTGAIGRQLAAWLAGRGPVKLVLQGTRELPAMSGVSDGVPEGKRAREFGALAAQLRALGSELLYVRGDASDRDRMVRIADEVRSRFGRIDGVFHLAGIQGDALLTRQTAGDMQAVLAPKVLGYQVLEQVTRGDELRCFVTFSSLAAVTGNRGQGAYAAANAYLDRCMAARARRSEGRSLSVAWGLWDGDGMTLSPAARARLEELGVFPLSAEAAFTALDWALAGDRAHLLIANVSRTGWSWIDDRVRSFRADIAGHAEANTAAPSQRSLVEVTANAVTAPAETLRACIEIIAGKLRLPPERLDPHAKFAEIGLDSFLMMEVVDALSARYGRPVHSAVLMENPSARELADYLDETFGLPSKPVASTHAAPSAEPVVASEDEEPVRLSGGAPAGGASADVPEPIAIIGMACRFPKAPSLESFWHNLQQGVDAIGPLPLDRFGIDRVPPGVCSRGGFLDDVSGFDEGFFGFSELEAVLMDPQQRLLLEVAEEAFEDAGCRSALAGSATGVFVGARPGTYYGRFKHTIDAMLEGADIAARRAGVVGALGNYIASHISHRFGLSGPAMLIDTACSSSLVAVHLACQAIRSGDCTLALVGGVDLKITLDPHTYLSRMRALSSDGQSRVFDARATGFVPGEGAGAVLIKRLDQALRDGDRIRAVIRGGATNNDGQTMGSTTPSLDGQMLVLRKAYDSTRLLPDTIGYVEAHGTGTPLGDPIEFKALSKVFAASTRRRGFCALGSVKSALGHLDTAAGIAGLIKVALLLQHGTLVPTLNVDEPNARLEIESSAFFINDRVRPWPARDNPRRAAVSSFGFGGTNAHLILEEPPPPPRQVEAAEPGPHLLTLSATDPAILEQRKDELVTWLEQNGSVRLSDVCATANGGHPHGAARLAVVATSMDEMLGGLSRATPIVAKRPRIAFMFPGQGSQYANMGRALYETQPAFRAAFDVCARCFFDLTGERLPAITFGASRDRSDAPIDTKYVQPSVFAVSYASAQLWLSWGIEPEAVIGHSLGEYAAACVAGAMSVESAMSLVVRRAGLMSSLPSGGGMLAVRAAEPELSSALKGDLTGLDVAAVNASNEVVLSGPIGALERARGSLLAARIDSLMLPVSHAFHSRMMDPIVAKFKALVAGVQFERPRLPIARNVDGALSTGSIDADYWLRQLRRPVQFRQALAALVDSGIDTLLEMSPGRVLCGLAGAQVQGERRATAPIPTSAKGESEPATLLEALRELYLRGARVAWHRVHPAGSAHRVSLPKYPFKRRRFWPEPTSRRSVEAPREAIRAPAAARAPEVVGPLLDVCTAIHPGYAAYEKRLTRDERIVADHVVLSENILPAAGHWEMVAEAVFHAFGARQISLRDVSIGTPLAVQPGGGTTVVVALEWPAEEPDPSTCNFRIMSKPSSLGASRQGFALHSAGAVELSPALGVSTTNVAELRSRIEHELPTGASYTHEYEAASGIHYGEWFRTLKRMWSHPTEILAEVQLPEAFEAEAARYNYHPALVDGALQAMAGIRLRDAMGDDSFVPLCMATVRLLTPVRGPALAHIRMHERRHAETLAADIRILAHDGRPLLEIEGFIMKRVSRRRLELPTAPVVPRYAWRWQLDAGGSAASEPRRLAGSSWLFLTDGSETCARVITALRQAGAQVIQVTSANGFRRVSPLRYRINCDSDADYEALVAGVRSDLGGREIAGVVHGFIAEAADVGALHDVELAQREGALSLLRLTRALAASPSARRDRPLPVWLLLRGGFAVSEGEPLLSWGAGAAWGLVNALNQEVQWLECRAVDLASESGEAGAERLVADFACPPAGDALAYRGDARYVRSLQPMNESADSQAPLPLRNDGVYMITGGLGDLGYEVAKFIAARVCARLIVVGRSPQPGRERWREELEARGCQARYVSCDVADVEALRALASAIEAEHGPVRGIVHAAGVIAPPEPLLNKSWQVIDEVLRPKIAGTWNLHRVFGAALDFMVLFSSSSSSAPRLARGLADYAMANAFMDWFAEQRSALGERVLSIGWANWGETGMGAASRRSFESRESTLSLSTASALSILEQGLRDPKGHFVVWGGAASTVNDGGPRAQPRPAGPQVAAGSAAPRRRGGHFQQFLSEQVARVLRTTPESVDGSKTFMEQGVDSLSLLAFARELEREYGLKSYPSLYFEYPTLDGLAAWLEAQHPAAVRAARSGAPGNAPIAQRAEVARAAERRLRLRYFMDRKILLRWTVRGHLDLALYERALTNAVRNHELLSVQVIRHGNAAELVAVRDQQPFSISFEDWSERTPEWREAALLQRVARERAERGEAMSWPVLRVAVIQYESALSTVLVAINHIVCDGWSMDLLQRDVLAEYERLRTGQPDGVAPNPSTFWDYLARLEAEHRLIGEIAIGKYHAALRDAARRCRRLPTDYPRRNDRDTHTVTTITRLSTVATGALKQLARRQGVTLYALLLSVVVRRLQLWTGSADWIIGMPVAGRDLDMPGIERVFGCLVNVVPLVIEGQENAGFEELMRSVSRICGEALRYVNYPVPHDVVPPLNFTFPNFANAEAAAGAQSLGPSWTFDEVWNELGADDVDLILLAKLEPAPTNAGSRGDEYLYMSWAYQPSLYEAATVESLAAGVAGDLEALADGEMLKAAALASAATETYAAQ